MITDDKRTNLGIRGALLFCAMMAVAPAQAASYTWNCASNYWDITACWSPNGTPTSADTVYAYVVSSADTFLRIDSITGSASAGTLLLGNSTTATVTLQQSGGGLTAATEYVGYTGAGTYTQDFNSANTVSNTLYLGYASGGVGNYTLSNGTLSVNTTGTSYGEFIGFGGTGSGTFTQTGGTHIVGSVSSGGWLRIGYGGNTTGSYSLSAGSLYAYYEDLGYNGTGNFTQTGGTHSVADGQLRIGTQSGSSGSYDLSGTGSLQAAWEIVGQTGTGTFTQTGGTNSTTNLRVGYLGGSGSYDLSGGTLSSRTATIGSSSTSNGTFTQTGGTFSLLGSFMTGFHSLALGTGTGSVGSYDLSAGVLEADYETIGVNGSGTFTQTGGSNTVTLELVTAQNAGSSGTYNLSAGTLTVGTNTSCCFGANMLTNNGTFDISGGTLTVGNLFIGGDTINNGNFIQSGGTVQTVGGSLENNGTFSYSGGTFNDRLINNGTLNLSADFTAADGMEHNTSLSINSIRTVTLNGGGLNNNGYISLYGLLNGSGTLTNNGTLYVGGSTIGGSGGFVNNAQVTVSGIATLKNTGANLNKGNMTLSSGNQFRLVGANLNNAGTLNLNNAIIDGSGALANSAGGLISGHGTINTTFDNSGGLLLVENGTTNAAAGFANTGTVQMAGYSANLTGGTINNNGGAIQGFGQVGNAINNAGTIEPLGGTLSLGGVVNNQAGGLMTAASGTKLQVMQGVATNAGVINLTGGTFDNNNHPLTSSNQISGYGVLRTGGLTNNGTMTITGATTTINGDVINNSYLEVAHNPAIFTGDVVNNGTFKTTLTTVSFAGNYTENGLFFSDPVNIFYNDWTVGENGVVTASAGDNYYVRGNFLNHSLQNTAWDTSTANLLLSGTGTTQTLELAGADLGALFSSYVDNFAWGSMTIYDGVSLSVGDGNAASGAALYVGLLDLQGGLTQLANISSDYNIYYDPTASGNGYLNGQTYALNGNGFLIPAAVPLPPAVWLFGSALLGLVAVGRRKRMGSSDGGEAVSGSKFSLS